MFVLFFLFGVKFKEYIGGFDKCLLLIKMVSSKKFSLYFSGVNTYLLKDSCVLEKY